MSEKFSVSVASVASGTDKTLINLFNPAASPTCRARVSFILVGSPAAPADQAATFVFGRTTAVGTEGSGFTPNNLDPAGPAGQYDSGLGVFGSEPTYTANKALFVFPVNQRATYQWYANPGFEFVLPATQNAGAGLKTTGSSSTQAHGATILFEE